MTNKLATFLRSIIKKSSQPQESATGTAVQVYQPTPREKVRTRLAERAAIAPTFITRVDDRKLSYFKLKPSPDINTISDRIGGANLMYDNRAGVKDLLDELSQYSAAYFDFEIQLFHFHDRKDRTIRDLFRRPWTHADLEEESIEEKFPEDMNTRALIVALYMVIVKNQWRHIVKKRLRQFAYTLPVAFFCITWLFVRHNIVAIERLSGYSLNDIGINDVVALGIFAGLLGAVFAGAKAAYKRSLRDTTVMFRAVNGQSCAELSAHMISINGKIRGLFNKLLINDVSLSQNDRPSVEQRDWPYKAEKVFKLALWQAKRIEYLEKFWQIQLERLRLFEIASDEVGNTISRVLALSVIAGFAWITGIAFSGLPAWYWLSVIGFFAATTWYFSSLSRREHFSFTMQDVVDSGFAKRWRPFRTVNYYEGIAEQYRSGKGAIQLQILRDLFPGGPPPR